MGRIAALAALLCVLLASAVVLLGGGEAYTITARFENASQLVKGNLVQVAGTKVGTVERIRLTDDGQAQVELRIDGDYAPLRQGTRAVVRQASLSGIANRYIDLRTSAAADAKPIPDGGEIPSQSTEATVDIDQLFSIFDEETSKDARTVIEGFSETAAGKTEQANAALHYLNPVLSSSRRLFAEVSRNDRALERFVVENARLVTDVADRREDLAGLVDNFATTSTALASRNQDLARSINLLPGFLRKANTTFVNLRSALDDLDPLVDDSRPTVRELRPLLRDLRPFARNAVPTFTDLARTLQAPGEGNDLVELFQAQPAVAAAALDRTTDYGKERAAAFPTLTSALEKSTPRLAFARPYSPDLVAWFDDFSTSGAYDALGSFSRAGLALSAFTVTPALNLIPVPPELRDEALAAGAELGRNNRCPGSSERAAPDKSNPYKPSADFNCDETIQPVGP